MNDKTAKGKKARPKRSGGSFMWLQGLACGALVTLATPTAALLLVFLLPGLIASVLDRAPGKPVARPMLLFGLAATVLPLVSLWRNGQTMPDAVRLFTDMGAVGLAWLAASVGWLLGEVIPMVVRIFLDAGAAARAVKLRAARGKYVEEWGADGASRDDIGGTARETAAES